MGAINYGHNNYINIGMNLKQFDNIDNYDDRMYEYETEFDYLWEETKALLNKYNLEYLTVKLEPGYYEGFYIHIDFDYLWVDYYEKPLILKELTQLKQFLLQCCENGMVQYFPGWGTSYANEQTTIKAIKECIKETKENIKNIQLIEHTEKEIKQIDNVMHFTFTHRNISGAIKNYKIMEE